MANIQIGSLPTFTGDTTGAFLVMNNSGNTQTFKVLKETLITGGGGSVEHLPTIQTNGALSSDEWVMYSNVSLFPIWLEAGQVITNLSLYVGASGSPAGTTIDLHLYNSQIGDIPSANGIVYPYQRLTQLATGVPFETPGKVSISLTPFTIEKTGFHFLRIQASEIGYYYRQSIGGIADGNAWNARIGAYNPFNINTQVANMLTAANVSAPVSYSNDVSQFGGAARVFYYEFQIN